jgi:hypothetical protein
MPLYTIRVEDEKTGEVLKEYSERSTIDFNTWRAYVGMAKIAPLPPGSCCIISTFSDGLEVYYEPGAPGAWIFKTKPNL